MERSQVIDLTTLPEDAPKSWQTMAEDKALVLIPSPCNIIVSSPTQGGKSTFVSRLLKHDMFQESPKKILYCYNSTWQPMFSKMESEINNITFHYGLPSSEDLEDFQTSTVGHKLIILDDLQQDATNTNSILNQFIIGTHHNNCSALLLIHNLFPKSKHGRTLSLNTQVFVLMSNPRDRQQVKTLGRQLGYDNLLEAYQMATRQPYTYLMIDLHNHTDNNLRIRTNIFPDETSPTTVYKI